MSPLRTETDEERTPDCQILNHAEPTVYTAKREGISTLHVEVPISKIAKLDQFFPFGLTNHPDREGSRYPQSCRSACSDIYYLDRILFSTCPAFNVVGHADRRFLCKIEISTERTIIGGLIAWTCMYKLVNNYLVLLRCSFGG